MHMYESGVINIYKEKGFTSHDVVAIVRRTLNVKAGHTGTLDPQAEGVLPVCIGKATQIAGLLTAENKVYRAELVLGITTDTGDLTGAVQTRMPVDFDTGAIRKAVKSFEGEYRQTPPMYSAVKVNGKKLYQLARAGKTVEREAKLVFIENIAILDFQPAAGRVYLEIACHKGTYIRTLCEDIGKKLGCGACMGELIRTRSGSFAVENSVTLERLKKAAEADEHRAYILPVEQVLPYARVKLDAGDAYERYKKLAINGGRIPFSAVIGLAQPPSCAEPVFLFDAADSPADSSPAAMAQPKLLGIYHVDAARQRLIPAIFLWQGETAAR